MRIRALILAAILALPILPIQPAQAASPCTKLNAVKVTGGTKYVCKRVNGKLVWQKQRATAVAPVASPRATPTPSPTRRPTPSPKPTPTPSGTEWGSCSKQGATIGSGARGLVCVRHVGELIWVSNSTLDNPAAGEPCRRHGLRATNNEDNFVCFDYGEGPAWDLVMPPATSLARFVSSGDGPGNCSVQELVSAQNARSNMTVTAVKSPSTGELWCIVRITGNAELRLPQNLGSNRAEMNILAVGGGGGGGADGGAGGSGGEVRFGQRVIVNSSEPLKVEIGAGGAGGVWTRGASGVNGASTRLSTNGLFVLAMGGNGGGTWGTRTANNQQMRGSGLTSLSGGFGGYDPISSMHACNPIPWTAPIAGGVGPAVELVPGQSLTVASGGGPGWGFTPNIGRSYESPATVGGGGAGARLFFRSPNLQEATAGFPGVDGLGGGGGGGSACDSPGGLNGATQRTDGGRGGSGVVYLSFRPQSVNYGGYNQTLWRNQSTNFSLSLNLPIGYDAGTLGIQVRSSAGLVRLLRSVSPGPWLRVDAVFESGNLAIGTLVDFFVDIPGFESFKITGRVTQ